MWISSNSCDRLCGLLGGHAQISRDHLNNFDRQIGHAHFPYRGFQCTPTVNKYAALYA